MQEKRLIGSLYGSGRPVMDIPHLVTLYQAGELKLRELVTRTYHLGGVNDALAALAAKVRVGSSAGDTVALACFVISLPATSEA